jgi:hypothetical protein
MRDVAGAGVKSFAEKPITVMAGLRGSPETGENELGLLDSMI